MKKVLLSAAVTACMATASQAGPITIVEAFGMPALSGSLDVVERMVSADAGRYDVTNKTGGELIGLGVSNNFTFPTVTDDTGTDGAGCSSDDSDTSFHCYSSRTLTARNWDEEIAYRGIMGGGIVNLTFQDIFGTFESVAGTDNTFNWFDSGDGALQDGLTESGFFGFGGALPASNIIGASRNRGGTGFFTAGGATPPTDPGKVPLPAAGWMLIAGLGGLGLMRRRRKG